MTLIIDGVSPQDKQLTGEITELVRQTAPELLSRARPRPCLGRVVAAVVLSATMLLMAASAVRADWPARFLRPAASAKITAPR